MASRESFGFAPTNFSSQEVMLPSVALGRPGEGRSFVHPSWYLLYSLWAVASIEIILRKIRTSLQKGTEQQCDTVTHNALQTTNHVYNFTLNVGRALDHAFAALAFDGRFLTTAGDAIVNRMIIGWLYCRRWI